LVMERIRGLMLRSAALRALPGFDPIAAQRDAAQEDLPGTAGST